MFLASFLIGLREGLEASLIVGILIAYVHRRGRSDVLSRIWWGVALAILITAAIGAVFTFGAYGLSFQAQEIIGGSMSLLACAMVTWMVFWMMRTGHRMKTELESGARTALAVGSGWAIAWIAFISVGREGIETTLMLWGWVGQPQALLGALTGIVAAVAIGYLVYRGMVRIDLAAFFAWTGAFLIVVAAGILAYGIGDLQEAAALPGPFSGHPITPTDLRTGDVLVGPTDGPYWLASFPFGWAFDVSDSIDASGLLGAFLKGTVGFTPQMSWLAVVGWAIYLWTVLPRFLRRVRANRRSRDAARPAPGTAVASTSSRLPATPASPAVPAEPTVPDTQAASTASASDDRLRERSVL